jgi:hypothetical protein
MERRSSYLLCTLSLVITRMRKMTIEYTIDRYEDSRAIKGRIGLIIQARPIIILILSVHKKYKVEQ